jgi:hypothetical protein
MAKTGVNVSVKRVSNAAQLSDRLKSIGKRSVYVGIPATTAKERSASLLEMAGKLKPGKRSSKLRKAAKQDVNNAELLFIFTNGSPLRKQPPRPVLQPAVQADGNKQAISHELAEAQKAALLGLGEAEVLKRLSRAGLAAQNAARRWFTDARNGWEPNAESTIRRKGSNRPGIDTGSMRGAITYVVDKE